MPEEVYMIGAVVLVFCVGFALAAPRYSVSDRFCYGLIAVLVGFAAQAVFINTTFWDTSEGLTLCMAGNVFVVAIGWATGDLVVKLFFPKRPSAQRN